MSVDYTPEEMAVIKQRQAHCKHGFIKGAADPTPLCAHCGISKAEYEATIQGYSAGSIWSGAMGGIP